jgi:uncharacterized protein (TIGR02271 family)
MAYQTIVAVFDTEAHADAAVKALKAGGFHDDDISEFSQDRMTANAGAVAGAKQAKIWHRVFGNNVHQHEAEVYKQTVDRGGVVVSVRVLDSEVAHATGILDLHRPVDVHDRAVTSGIAPAAHVETVAKTITAAAPLAVAQTVAVAPKLAEAHDDVLRLAEEQLSVGKQMVETGRTRVRRFTTEREESAEVSLHEEHAELMRRAVTDPAFIDSVEWADHEIEVIETAEHALVNKTARVVEEVSLRKVGSDHVETVHERLRRQQVEIQRVGADGKPLQA